MTLVTGQVYSFDPPVRSTTGVTVMSGEYRYTVPASEYRPLLHFFRLDAGEGVWLLDSVLTSV